MNRILSHLESLKKDNRKSLAVLIDPDKITDAAHVNHVINLIKHAGADIICVGGSLIMEAHFHQTLKEIKEKSCLPVLLFPGSPHQVSPDADAMLFLSLISGRNPELLIGQHVQAAPMLKKVGIEIIPTGYMIIDGGKQTTASYMSNTNPLPANKPDIAVATALAGELLGMRCIYMDGGSGAEKPISPRMIEAVRHAVEIPIIIGGGIRTERQVQEAYEAGADMVVIGTAFENDPEVLFALCEVKDRFGK
ncbi:MAG: geranylgeranylglyceryl/heptaprenylglyceryl phosphate synthase [Flavobacteriales bacterium]|jgi:putative glycerol-1-phosphate prenyltransferase